MGALSITQALSAFDPSIRLAESLTNGSNPNVLPDITIRGENGFDLRANADDATTNPNAPLYILDGVEVSAERVYDMDVNRVEVYNYLERCQCHGFIRFSRFQWSYCDHDDSPEVRADSSELEC